MKATRNPFSINIGFLINQPIGYSRNIPFESDKFEMGDELYAKKLAGKIRLIRNQDGFRGQAEFVGLVDSECGRCLQKFEAKIHSEFEEYFTFPFVDSSDEEIQVPEDGNVDFAPIVRDYLLMEVRINPVCREDCKGLCDICGVNLNETSCGHDHKKSDEPTPKNNVDWDSIKKALEP